MAAAGKPVGREDAAAIRATVLAKGGDVRNPRAFIGKVLGDPHQARAYAPGAAAHPDRPRGDRLGPATGLAERRAHHPRRRGPRPAVHPRAATRHHRARHRGRAPRQALARAQLADEHRRHLQPINQGPQLEPGRHAPPGDDEVVEAEIVDDEPIIGPEHDDDPPLDDDPGPADNQPDEPYDVPF